MSRRHCSDPEHRIDLGAVPGIEHGPRPANTWTLLRVLLFVLAWSGGLAALTLLFALAARGLGLIG